MLFSLSWFYFLTIFANFPFLLVTTGKILMTSLQLISWSCVCSSGWVTIFSTTSNPASGIPGRGASFVGRYLSGDGDRAVFGAVCCHCTGVYHHDKFQITPSSHFLHTFHLYLLFPLFLLLLDPPPFLSPLYHLPHISDVVLVSLDSTNRHHLFIAATCLS